MQVEIDVTQLSLIINGIDLRSAKRRRRYQTAPPATPNKI